MEQAITGAVTFIQRGDSALRLNPHFHTIALDGVYVRGEDGELCFHPLDPPSWEDVAQVAAWTYEKLTRVLVHHGRSLEGLDELPDALASEHPVLASCYGASAGDVQLLGEKPGERVDRLTSPVLLTPTISDALAEVGGVNVHAKVSVDGRDRERVESLCRYLARPPVAQDRLSIEPEGMVRYDFKAAWKDGTRAVRLHPLDFLARLAALVPPPRFHMVRYLCVLQPLCVSSRDHDSFRPSLLSHTVVTLCFLASVTVLRFLAAALLSPGPRSPMLGRPASL